MRSLEDFYLIYTGQKKKGKRWEKRGKAKGRRRDKGEEIKGGNEQWGIRLLFELLRRILPRLPSHPGLCLKEKRKEK